MAILFSAAGARADNSTSKAFARIDPRTPVQSLEGSATSIFVITTPGSYYLTDNIVGVPNMSGIEITSDNVTLNLRGFSLTGVSEPGSLNEIGVDIQGNRSNVVIMNGFINNWKDGIFGRNTQNGRVREVRLDKIHADGIVLAAKAQVTACTVRGSGNGFGILVGDLSTVSQCAAENNFTAGIEVGRSSAVIDSSSVENGEKGISIGPGSTVGRCVVARNGNSGISGEASTIVNCVAINNFIGIDVSKNGVIIGCTVTNNSSYGIQVAQSCLVRNNTLGENKTGISVEGSQNRIDSNNITGGDDTGIMALIGGNLIIRNSVRVTGTGYVLSGLNTFGPIITGPAVITTINPWANFEY